MSHIIDISLIKGETTGGISMRKFKKAWDFCKIEYSEEKMSKQAKAFVRCFKEMIKYEVGEKYNAKVSITPGFYSLSGLIEKEGYKLELQYNIPKDKKINLRDSKSVSYRLIHDEYKTPDNLCSILDIPQKFNFLLEYGIDW